MSVIFRIEICFLITYKLNHIIIGVENNTFRIPLLIKFRFTKHTNMQFNEVNITI